MADSGFVEANNQARLALLQKITLLANNIGVSGQIKDLAEAYAAVVHGQVK